MPDLRWFSCFVNTKILEFYNEYLWKNLLGEKEGGLGFRYCIWSYRTQSFEASLDDHNYTRAIRMNKEATIEAHLVENSHLEAGSE